MAIEGKIIDKLVSITSGVSGIGEVSNYEKASFRAFPAVTIVGSESESDFEATAERREVYSFKLTIYQELHSEQTPNKPTLKDADRILRNLSDNLLDTFRKPTNSRLSGQADTTAEKVILVDPLPTEWGFDTERNMRTKSIKIKVVCYINTSLL